MIYRYVILSSLKEFQYERSISAVYYLIQGKQSIQTIQDAHLFNLSHLYRIAKKVNKDKFMKEINKLEQADFIKALSGENTYELTAKADEWLQDNKSQMDKWYVNGMRYHYIDDLYFERLLLIIQVWTNFSKQERSYIPVVERVEVKQWVKHYIKATKMEVSSFLEQLHRELVAVLSQVDSFYAEVFVLQLTSYKQYGLAKVQIAEKYGMQIEDVELITLSVIHQIIRVIDTEPNQYHLLNQVKSGLVEEGKLTISASKTNTLLQKGWAIDQIANYRRLKQNTIHDHLVEIAIHDKMFDLYDYVTIEQQNEVIKAIQQVQSYSLKEIKQVVDETISYFQIRLVLTTWNQYTK